MRKRNLLKTAIFGFVCSASLTACNFQFSVNDNATPTPIETSAISEIAGKIDNTDLTNKEELSTLTSDIYAWSEQVSGDYIGDFQCATLVRVVDGDTIIVDIAGEEASVRMIGINTPESVAGQDYLDRTGKENTIEGKNASDYTKALLEDTYTVYLQSDTTDTDKYGRLLRYVWTEVPKDYMDIDEIKTEMINGMLLADHIAEVTIYHPDDMYEEQFKQIYAEKE